MGEFIGLFRRGGTGIEPALLTRFGNSLGGVAKPRHWQSENLLLVHRAARDREIPDAAAQPRVGPGGTVVMADALLDSPREMASAIGMERAELSDSAMVAAACARWGSDAATRLVGPFAFALWEERAERLTLARDTLGAKSLFYVERGGDVVFASTLPSLLALPMVPRDLDELVLAQILTIDKKDQERTLYRDIRAVPPGGMAVFTAGSSSVRRYWTVDDIAPVRFRHDADYVEAGRELLDRAVAARIRGRRQVAVTLSGGLDSAGVAATAAAARLGSPDRVTAFHRAPGGAHPYSGALDERTLAQQIVAGHANLDLRVIEDDRSSRYAAEPEAEASLMQMPRGGGVNGRWFDSLFEAVVAADPDVLLVGDSGNATLSWDGTPLVGTDLLRGRWGRAWDGLQGMAMRQQRSIATAAATYLLRPIVPRPVLRWRARRAAGPLSRWATYSMVSSDFLDRLDYERTARETGHDVPFASQGTDQRASRLRMVQGRAHRDGGGGVARRQWRFDVRDPYADRRLVEFALGVPDEQYSRGATDRWLARRVLADRLPTSVIEERRRGLQCPEWYDIVSARRENMIDAVERIERSPLASSVVDIARMKRLLADWPVDAEAAKGRKQVLGHALQRGIAIGGFLRWHEGGNG